MMIKKLSIAVIMCVVVFSTSVYCTSLLELRGPYLIGTNTASFDPSLAKNNVTTYSGFGAGLGYYVSNNNYAPHTNSETFLFGTVNQDMFDHTLFCLGIMSKNKLMVSPDWYLEANCGIGLGSEYSYNYVYGQGNADTFSSSQYISALIPYSLGIGTYWGNRPISVQFGGTLSLRPVLDAIIDFTSTLGINKTSSQFYSPSYMATITLQVGI